jgi:hypothetical protein
MTKDQKRIEKQAKAEKAMVKWQHGVAPSDVPANVTVIKPGQEIPVFKNGKAVMKDGKQVTRTSKQLVIAPTPASKLKEADKSLTDAAANAANEKAAKESKPIAAGRLAMAAASEAFVLRRHTENPESGLISTTLKRTNANNRLAAIAAEYGLTEDEVKSRLSEKPTEIGK